MAAHPDRRFVVVCGGGDPARRYQAAYRALARPLDDAAADWIGIAATRLNAELIKRLFADLAPDEVVTDPTTVTEHARHRCWWRRAGSPAFPTITTP